MKEMSNNKTIAKNTIFLYIRTMIIMVVSLYTSRVILQKLGIDDFGIYQAVGGIVGFLSFLNSALGTGTSRFLTYELGTGNKERLKDTFTTALTVHVLLALLIAVIAETIGLWYFNNKMVIPEDRFNAAAWVFHISILTAIINIITVPFNASIISHEKMKVFAYVGIVESFCKLGVVYLLSIGNLDRLILYAILLLLIQISIFCFYIVYCRHNFEEFILKLFFDRELFKQIFGFSGWSLFANGSIALNNQGILLLLNYFFPPAVITARTISLQVNNAANHFVGNFRTAANPQIVKSLAAGDVKGSHRLLLESVKFSYFLMLFFCLPICLLASPLLNVWLEEVPEYTVPFLQLAVIQSLFQVFDTSFYTALYAIGRIKANALISPTFGFIQFPIVYILFKMGFSPLALSWASLISYAIVGVVVKSILIHKIAGYKWRDILEVLWVCLLVTVLAVPIPTIFYFCLGVDTIMKCAVVIFFSIISIAFSVWKLGLNYNQRVQLLQAAKNRNPFLR